VHGCASASLIPISLKTARVASPFHEAGHVVVGWALGLEIGGTRIRPDGTGGADIAASDSLPLVDRVAIYMAGIVAAEMSGVEAVHEKEIWGDMGEVVSIGSREHPGDESAQLALMRAGRVRAASILTVHGAVLSRLSNELERAGELDAEAVARLLAL
jgi:hypothetical protein